MGLRSRRLIVEASRYQWDRGQLDMVKLATITIGAGVHCELAFGAASRPRSRCSQSPTYIIWAGFDEMRPSLQRAGLLRPISMIAFSLVNL